MVLHLTFDKIKVQLRRKVTETNEINVIEDENALNCSQS